MRSLLFGFTRFHLLTVLWLGLVSSHGATLRVEVGQGGRPVDRHLRTDGALVAAANFGSVSNQLRGLGAGILFAGVDGGNPSGTNWSVAAPFVDGDLGGVGLRIDPLFFSEVYGPNELSLTCSNLNPALTYLVQVLHGEPRDCCIGYFQRNEFTTRLPGGATGPKAAVPGFYLGNSQAAENPPDLQDYAVVTAQVTGVQSVTYFMRDASGSRGPSMAGFQLRVLPEPPVATVVVQRGDNPVGLRPADGHLRTDGTLRVAVRFGNEVDAVRGPGAGVRFRGVADGQTHDPSLYETTWAAVDDDLGGGGAIDSLFFREIYGPEPVTLTCPNLDPSRTYLLQVLHGEPRECCTGVFAANTFTTRLPGGGDGPVLLVPPFQLGNGVANENPPASEDLAVVTAQFSGVESITYVMVNADGGSRGPSIAAFQLREVPVVGVTSVADSGPGSLRDAVAAARPGDVLRFAPAMSGRTIFLKTGPITVSRDLVVDASALPRGLLINGSRLGRIFNVAEGATVEMRGLILTNGWVTGLSNPDGPGGLGQGGAIFNAGTLTLRQCQVVRSTAVGGAGIVAGNAEGGGIYNSGQLTLDRCVVSGNAARAGFEGSAWGGGVANFGYFSMTASTIADNLADGGVLGRWGRGGGLLTFGLATNLNSTVSGNVARGGGAPNGGAIGGGIYTEGLAVVRQTTISGNVVEPGDGVGASAFGGGIENSQQLQLEQSTVSDNGVRPGIVTPSEANAGGLRSQGGVVFINSIVAGNWGGDDTVLIGDVLQSGTNLVSGDPGLAPLAKYDGLTATMPPLAGSPAIDTGSDEATNSFAADQVGRVRLAGVRVDIGAVEYQPAIAPALVQVTPRQVMVGLGTNLTLRAGPSGSPEPNYQWFFNKKPIPGANGRVLALTNIQASQGGAYQVRVENGYGIATSAASTVRVLLPPVIRVQPINTVVIEGRSATLKVSAAGSARLLYQWRRNGRPVPGATNAVLKIAVARTADSGDYTVIVRNAVGEVLSTQVQLVVVPALITRQPVSLTVALGSRAVFSVSALSTQPLSYQWRKDGTDIPRATESTLILTNVQTTDVGTYSVVIENIAGTVESAGAALMVFSPSPAREARPVGGAAGVSALAPASGTGSGTAWPVGDAGNVAETPRVSAMAGGPGRVRLFAPAGAAYVVEASVDLSSWRPVGTVTGAGMSVAVDFEDPASVSYPARFYRVRPAR